jgi:hypothetical protein
MHSYWSSVNNHMRMLWDSHTVLPYRAVAPWPVVIHNGQPDWIEAYSLVEDWLNSRVGPHHVAWAWSMWSLHQADLCGVSFRRESDSTLFLLRYS